MSKRRILDVTSEKKRDKMLTYTNSTGSSQSGGTTYTQDPAILTGGSATPRTFVWCATARDNTVNSGGRLGNKFDVATRTASNCYMVGLKESIAIQCADGLPWQWRRICFTYKGSFNLRGYLPSSAAGFYPAVETGNGYARVLNQLTGPQLETFMQLVMRGAQNVDWVDHMNAKTDTQRISVMYDKTITIASGNEDGVIRKYNRWHAMGHNLVYDDDEKSGSIEPLSYSVESKVGMGDYWVVDIFKPRVGSTSSNQMLFNCESTLYWHEK